MFAYRTQKGTCTQRSAAPVSPPAAPGQKLPLEKGFNCRYPCSQQWWDFPVSPACLKQTYHLAKLVHNAGEPVHNQAQLFPSATPG